MYFSAFYFIIVVFGIFSISMVAARIIQNQTKQQTPEAKGGRSLPAVPVLQKKELGAELPIQGQFLTRESLSQLNRQMPAAVPVQRKTGTDGIAGLAPSKPFQLKANNTGLPDTLKAGIESLSGYNMSDVKVHYNSAKPAQLQALAYAQGTDIHLAPGQERHLPHEAWHVVQQKQGRVQPTMQMKGSVPVNDNQGLEHEADVMGAKANIAGSGNAPVAQLTANTENVQYCTPVAQFQVLQFGGPGRKARREQEKRAHKGHWNQHKREKAEARRKAFEEAKNRKTWGEWASQRITEFTSLLEAPEDEDDDEAEEEVDNSWSAWGSWAVGQIAALTVGISEQAIGFNPFRIAAKLRQIKQSKLSVKNKLCYLVYFASEEVMSYVSKNFAGMMTGGEGTIHELNEEFEKVTQYYEAMSGSDRKYNNYIGDSVREQLISRIMGD